jgi:hypothetical protein
MNPDQLAILNMLMQNNPGYGGGVSGNMPSAPQMQIPQQQASLGNGTQPYMNQMQGVVQGGAPIPNMPGMGLMGPLPMGMASY